jgi:type IV secretion system protein TrbG
MSRRRVVIYLISTATLGGVAATGVTARVAVATPGEQPPAAGTAAAVAVKAVAAAPGAMVPAAAAPGGTATGGTATGAVATGAVATGGTATGAAATPGLTAATVAAEVVREARAVAAGREPAVIEHGDVVLAPYGHQVPVLRCAPLRVCLIELEEGELVLNTVTGDTARWILDRAVAGPRAATALIVAKPTACNLTTNLAITTDRRIYQVTLDARPCRSEEGENPHEPFTRLLRFYYPDELVRTWASAEEARRAAVDAAARAAAAEAQAVTPLGARGQGREAQDTGLPLAALHFGYRWTRSGKVPWTPAAVFDDGVHTYIRLPGSGVGQEAPVLFLIDRHGAAALLNYTIRGQYYVTDRVFERAALVLGSGRDQRRLEIVRER